MLYLLYLITNLGMAVGFWLAAVFIPDMPPLGLVGATLCLCINIIVVTRIRIRRTP